MPFVAALLCLFSFMTSAFAADAEKELRELTEILKSTRATLSAQKESAATVTKITSIGGTIDYQAQTLISQLQTLQTQTEVALQATATTTIDLERFIDSAYVLLHRSNELTQKLLLIENETNSASKRLDIILVPYLKALNESPNKALIREARFERMLILNDYLSMRLKPAKDQNTFLDYEWRDVLAILEPTIKYKDTLPVAQTEALQSKLRHAIALSLLPGHTNFLTTKTEFIAPEKLNEITKWLWLPFQAFAFQNPASLKGVPKQPLLSMLTWGFNLLVGLPIGGAIGLYTGNATPAVIGLFSAHIAIAALSLPIAVVTGTNQAIDVIFSIPENLLLLRHEKDLVKRIQTLQENPLLAGTCNQLLTKK